MAFHLYKSEEVREDFWNGVDQLWHLEIEEEKFEILVECQIIHDVHDLISC